MPLMGQYEYVIDPAHPRANEEGQVYLHIIIAEQKIGRHLLSEEVVHHIDFNKLNNNPNNLMVFSTKGDHTRFHHYNCDEQLLSLDVSGSYVCSKIHNQCIDCGAQITRGAMRCKVCSYKDSQVAARPTSSELFDMLVKLNGNFTEAGRQYGVSDNAVRKWCILYNISSHSKDYKT